MNNSKKILECVLKLVINKSSFLVKCEKLMEKLVDILF